jgi:hypothetical protein
MSGEESSHARSQRVGDQSSSADPAQCDGGRQCAARRLRSVSSGGDNLGHRAGNRVNYRAGNRVNHCSTNDISYRFSYDHNDSIGGDDVDCGSNDDIRKRYCRTVNDKHRGFHRGGRGEFPPSDRYEGHYLELLQPGRCPH